MALVSHTIYSFYKPEGEETPDQSNEIDEQTRWDKAAQSGGLPRIPPRFIAARVAVDEYGRPILPETSEETLLETPGAGPSVSSWYRSLTKDLVNQEGSRTTTPAEPRPPSRPLLEKAAQKPVKPHKQDWFSSSHPKYAKPAPPIESIAQKLNREPPTTQPKKPKVWIALGPSNKGYEMLSNKGWVEGEGLGAKAGIGMRQFLQENAAGRTGDESEVTEVEDQGVIDLTLSDSDSDEEAFDPSAYSTPTIDESATNELPSGGIRLLTPLSTTLKSDRLGIGLSAKYVETPSGLRIPTKRITHGEKAIQAHSKAADEARRQRQKWGRGSRGQQRRQKAESKKRQELLQYLNS